MPAQKIRTVQKVTPVLVVEKIEPVVGFWKKLGLSLGSVIFG
jgi:hypothetical protein